VLAIGVLLLLASMGMGVLGLVKRGYELLVVIAMGVLLLFGFGFIITGLIA
jgi:hypothetical protein